VLETIFAIAAAAGLSAAGYFYLQNQKKEKPPKKLPEKKEEPPISVSEAVPLSVAEAKAREIILSAKDEALKIKSEAENEARQLRRDAFTTEQRLSRKEEGLRRRQDGIEKRERGIAAHEEKLQAKEKRLNAIISKEVKKLEKIASLSREEAKKELFQKLERELADEYARKIKEAEEVTREEADKKAREILLSTLQRIVSDVVPAATSSQVKLPDEEMKGRIIGKEGRNVKAFEMATGVKVEVSDEPGLIIVSSFDPVRREVARIALEKLIADGRIQPVRIEEIVKKTQEEIDQIIHETGKEHAYKAGVSNLPRTIIDLLGRFKYRTSYGQNMLEHNLEVVEIGKLLAQELGADTELVKKACLLHDIGKAVSAETEGGHAEVGADICRRYGIDEEVVKTFEGHHRQNFPNLEAMIVYLADAISGARPGARREDYEAFLKRVEELENIADSFPGVEKSYAVSAGREIRVIVRPQDISDAEMVKLAHSITKKIHEQVQNFPGEIKVTVIREVRAVDVAKPKNE